MHRFTRLAAFAALFAFAASPAWAATITTADGNGADSYVRLGQPANNFGGASTIVVKDAGGDSTTRKGYLRFDLSSTTGVYSGYSLNLDVALNDLGGAAQSFNIEVLGLLDGNAGENWDEGTITFNNAPANSGSNQITSDAVRLGVFNVPAVAAPNSVSFASPTLDAFLNQDTDGNATLIVRRLGGSSSANLTFASKENGGLPAPTLAGDDLAADIRTFAPDADTYVQQGQATTNFGGSSSIVIKDNGGAGTTRKGYVRFDIPVLNTDAVGAWLDMEVSSNNQGGGGSTPQTQRVNVFGLLDGDAGENWGEGTINWDNAPANTGGDGFLANAIELGHFIVRNSGSPQRILFASDELLDFINDDTNGLATLIFQRETSSGSWNLTLNTKESGGFAPRLSLAVPVPTPAALPAALAMLGLVASRRLRGRGRSSRRWS